MVLRTTMVVALSYDYFRKAIKARARLTQVNTGGAASWSHFLEQF